MNNLKLFYSLVTILLSVRAAGMESANGPRFAELRAYSREDCLKNFKTKKFSWMSMRDQKNPPPNNVNTYSILNIISKNGKKLESQTWKDEYGPIEIEKLDCEKDTLIVIEKGEESTSHTWVDLLNGTHVPFMQDSSWSPRRTYFIKWRTSESADYSGGTAGIEIWSCLNRSEKAPCSIAWENRRLGLRGTVSGITWSQDVLNFSAHAGEAEDDGDEPNVSVTCKLSKTVECKEQSLAK